MKLCLSILLLHVGTLALGRQVLVPNRCLPEYRRDTDPLPSGCEAYENLGDCRRQADVAFVLDASRSIGETDFGKEKQFFQKILEAFQVGSDFSKFAAITFSDKPKLEFNLNKYNNRTSLSDAVNKIDYADGPATLMYDALQYTRENLFTIANGGRPGVQDVVILVTDGVTQNPKMTKSEGLRRTQEQAELLKNSSAFIVTIGVGPYINENELTAIASGPEYYLKVSSYEELNEDDIVNKVTNLTCKELPPCPNNRIAKYMQAHEGRVRRESPPIWPPSLPIYEVCKGIPVDLLFILDQSTSLGTESFRKELDFVNDVIANIDSNLLGVSVMTFSDEASIEIRFGQFQSRKELTQAISNIVYGGGNTYTHKALSLMLLEGFSAQNGARPGIDRIGVIVTDGGSTDPSRTKSKAAEVQEAGIQMFAIGVGPEFATNKRNNKEELNVIGSDPDENFVFTVDDADGLATLHKEISRKVCEDKCKDEPDKLCKDKPADIVFLLDDSTSLDTEANFMKELSFVSDLVASFNVGPDAQRVAAITFSTNAETEFHLDTYGSRAQVQNALASIAYSRGNTNMHLAFQKMLGEEFSGQRDSRNVDKIAVVVTDGIPTDPFKLKDQVQEAKARGITIFAVGIGNDVNINKLNEIASEPSEYFSFSVTSLDALSQIRRQMGLRICESTRPRA